MGTTAAIFFDVDFTLIAPGPRFQASGYELACADQGIAVDPALFDAAVAGAASVLEDATGRYDAELFVAYTQRIIELMGGRSPRAEAVARQLYAEWASHDHFSLYEDVRETLEALARDGFRLGVISNSHRCLDSFLSHFDLDALISVTISSADLGYLKPHPRIFQAALERMGVRPAGAVMVGDSLAHDVRGAERAGMRGVLIDRRRAAAVPDDVAVIASLRELPALLG